MAGKTHPPPALQSQRVSWEICTSSAPLLRMQLFHLNRSFMLGEWVWFIIFASPFWPCSPLESMTLISPSDAQLRQCGVTDDLCSALKWLGVLTSAGQQRDAEVKDWAMQVREEGRCMEGR